METLNAPSYEWGVAALTHRDEAVSGDQYLVTVSREGVLVAVIDALGHGEQAYRAAARAVRVLTQYAREVPVALVRRCHAELRPTRGAALGLAWFDWGQRTLTWLGVGNVAGMLVRAGAGVDPRPLPLMTRGGVIGDQLPALRPSVLPLAARTMLVLASDGVSGDFTAALSLVMTPQRLAQRVLDQHARHDDDATVLVFRCGGAT
jgi:hypothetical protein